jgi:hypothetical protein
MLLVSIIITKQEPHFVLVIWELMWNGGLFLFPPCLKENNMLAFALLNEYDSILFGEGE